MQVLDRTGVGTLWSMCKTKFALAGHTHNSLAAVGNEQISATAYGSGLHFKPYYNSGGPTIYGNILEYTSTNTGGGQLAMEWTGSQTKSDGTDSNVGRVYYRSKRDCINGWTKWMTLAYTNDIPTKLSQLTNDKGFVTGSVSGNTVTINGASTTWTNTWRGIQDNLTSTSTSESLSANQGRILKGLVDGKANSSHTHNYAGSGSAGGSANSAISVVDYGQTSKTIQIGYAGAGITGEQIKYIAGYTTGSGDVNAKIKDISKDALRSWLGLGTLAYSSATITDNKVTQNAVKSSDYTNWRSLVFSAANSATEGFTPSTTTDGVFIANTLSVQPSSGTIRATKFKGTLEGNASTASNASTVNGHTVNANVPSNAKFTDTNTWRPIHDNLTSTSTSESLSANQGRVLKGLVDGKANSNHTHSWSQISGAPATATRWPSWGEVTGKPGSFTPSSHTHDWSQITGKPDLKNWSETKSYIDNKVDSASNIVTLKEYLQKQLDQFGLKVGCGVVSEKIDRTCYQAFETGASETVNKYIYDTVNNIKLDTETNISTKLNGSNIYYDIVFDKYFYDSGEFYDNNFQLLKRIGTVNSYLIGPDFMYTRNYENRKLYIYDKNLNVQTVDIPSSFGYINTELKDLGDDGILIRNKAEGKYSSLIYKDGVFKESNTTYTSACYNINGHLYNKNSLGTILTKNIAIKSNKKYLCKNGCLHLQLFTIKDLYNNKDYNISIPIELYQFSDLDRTERNKVFGLILSSYAYDKDAIYYIVIYRE